jgi:hypothetical protein
MLQTVIEEAVIFQYVLWKLQAANIKVGVKEFNTLMRVKKVPIFIPGYRPKQESQHMNAPGGVYNMHSLAVVEKALV